MAVARILRPTNNFSNIPERVRARVVFWTRYYARQIQRSIQAEMRKPKHGLYYTYRGRKYRASAPGEAPAIRSGALYRDLNPRYSAGGMRATISPRVVSETGAPYPDILEKGLGQMEARPFMKPAFNRYRELYKAQIRRIFDNL